ncbi:MAG: alpha/beta fold hydrolase [Acholeplasmatales bacterium]|nr:alpha/beta fold hydrolase [Acholeplasmatales bacterium]
MTNDIYSIKVNNKTTNYFKFGCGKNIMVIIPGLSIKSVIESKDIIINDYHTFEEEYTVYCFDRIRDVDNNYSIFDMAKDLEDVLIELKLDNIYLFGTSQGGMISMIMAINKVINIKKLVLGSTTYIIDNNKFNQINEWINLAINRKSEDLCLSFSKLIYPEEVFNKSLNLVRDLAKTITDEELDRFIVFAKALKDFNIISKLKEINCDTLFINDKTDKLLGDMSSLINNINLPKISSYTYEGYGHAAYDLAPDYKEKIKEFFEK